MELGMKIYTNLYKPAYKTIAFMVKFCFIYYFELSLRKSWDSGAPNRHSCITKSTNRNATTNWNSILSSLGELASQIECAATPTCW